MALYLEVVQSWMPDDSFVSEDFGAPLSIPERSELEHGVTGEP
jgi:hypothetical protein